MVRRSLRSRILALATLLGAGTSALALAPTASAAPVGATEAVLTWKVSQQAWTSSSLDANHDTSAPATRNPAIGSDTGAAPDTDPSRGFIFPEGTGTYDPATGAASVDFGGSLTLGNTVQGGYRIILANPSVVIDGDGGGRLLADVFYRTSAVGAFTTPVEDVVIVDFAAGDGADDDGTVTWTVTPDFPYVSGDEGFRQFSAPFMAALDPSLQGHFRESGAASDANKPPAPFTLSLDHEAAEEPEPPAPDPRVTVTPTTDLDPGGATVTVAGTGFTKAPGDASMVPLGVYVQLCAAPAGEVGTPAGRPGSTQCSGESLWVGPTAPPSNAVLAPDGTFSAPFDVVAAFTAAEATPVDCHDVGCGVFVRRDHNGGAADHSYDSFTPIAFAGEPSEPEEPPEEPEAPAPGEGALDWGVKASFRSYILHGPAAGTIETEAPASTNADGTFRFAAGPGGSYDGPGEVAAPFEGEVHFSGHGGLLDLVITDPRVTIDGEDGMLVVDAASKGLESGTTETYDDVTFAALDLSEVSPTAVGNDVTFSGVPAVLTEDGSEAFAGFYERGEALDPLTFVIAVADPGSLPAPTEAVVGCVPATVVAGGTVPVCADGFLPGEQVQAFLHSTPVQLALLTADAAGGVVADLTIPVTTPGGSHRIELRGVSSGRSLFSAPFAVTAAARSGLPATGVSTVPPLTAALALLGAGAGLVLTTRRRFAHR